MTSHMQKLKEIIEKTDNIVFFGGAGLGAAAMAARCFSIQGRLLSRKASASRRGQRLGQRRRTSPVGVIWIDRVFREERISW